MLCNLKETFYAFKEIYIQVKLGFSIFAALRPPYCILAGSSGTHTVCVCKTHQNIKLLLQALDLESLDETRTWDYKDILMRINCSPITDACLEGNYFQRVLS